MEAESFPLQEQACERQHARSLNVLCVRSKPRDEMTTNHFPGGGVCALGKEKKKEEEEEKKKKKGNHGGREWVVETPRSGEWVWGGEPLPV